MDNIQKEIEKLEFEESLIKERLNILKEKISSDKKNDKKTNIETIELHPEGNTIISIIKTIISIYTLTYIFNNYGDIMISFILSMLKLALIYYLGFIGIFGILVYFSYLLYRIDSIL